jgi:hypothetical protein
VEAVPTVVEGAWSEQENRPYEPGWIDRLGQAVERLPGPDYLPYLLVAAAFVAVVVGIKWADGTYPVGTVFPFHLVYATTGVAYIALIRYLDRVAARALEEFRPAIDPSMTSIERARYHLTHLPRRETLYVTVLGLAYGLYLVVVTPRGIGLNLQQLQLYTSPASIWFDRFNGIIIGTTILLFAYHAVHQLRTVSQIYAATRNIDLFNLKPLYAFSRVTAITSGVWLLIVYVWMATVPDFFRQSTLVTICTMAFVLSIVAFIWPLQGIHRLLVAEKERWMLGVKQRIKHTITALHGRIDEDKYEDTEALAATLDGLRGELELLATIPTWPWEPGLLRAMLTTFLLPLILWLATGMLERLLQL